MPIKFRCLHCNQFLGISRAQSGSIVDCPTCGRSIRVPNLDGTVAPLPKPEIDLADHSLASALEQLASLQEEVAGQNVARPSPAATPAIAPPPTIVAASIEPPAVSISDAPLARKPPASAKPWIEVEKELATLTGTASPAAGEPTRTTLTRRDLLVAGSTALVTIPVTWWISRPSRSAAVTATNEAARAPQNAGRRNDPPPIPEPAPSLTGRITYLTADGESRPDAGARVLIFPEHRQGSTLLSVDGFRSNAAAADLQLAKESMKLYGGAYVTADDGGRYGAVLSSSGTYEILMISNYQTRPAAPLPGDLLKALGRYFDRPQQLIGQTAYEFSHLRFTGREPAVRDQVFVRA